MALIQQMRADKALVAKLKEKLFGEHRDVAFSIKPWGDVRRNDRVDLYRIRSWDLEDQGLHFRLIYHIYKGHTYILAVVPRGDMDYDNPAHPIRRRVLETIRNEFRP